MQVCRDPRPRFHHRYLTLFFEIPEEVWIDPHFRLNVFPSEQLVVTGGDVGKLVASVLIARHTLEQIGARTPIRREQDGRARYGLLVLVANHSFDRATIGRNRYFDADSSGPRKT